jgi:hypothetical protein
MSWKPEVEVEGGWSRNGLVFKTKDEAERSAQSLFQRWTLTTGWRAVEVDEPVNYLLTRDGQLICVEGDEERRAAE